VTSAYFLYQFDKGFGGLPEEGATRHRGAEPWEGGGPLGSSRSRPMRPSLSTLPEALIELLVFISSIGIDDCLMV